MAYSRVLRFSSRFSSLPVRSTLIRTQGFVSCSVTTSCDNTRATHGPSRVPQHGSLSGSLLHRLVLPLPHGVRFASGSTSSGEWITDKMAGPTTQVTGDQILSDKFAAGTPASESAAEALSSGVDIVSNSTELLTEAANIATHIPFKELGLCHKTPPGLIESLFEIATVDLGLGWLPAIALCTLLFRAFLFPVHLMSVRNSVKMMNIRPQMQALQKEAIAVKNTFGQEAAMEVRRRMIRLYVDNDVSFFKGLLMPLCQLPLVMSFYMAIRHMATVVPTMATGGILFFTDLTVRDPFFILPLSAVGLMMLTIEKGADTGTPNPVLIEYRLAFRALSCISLPILSQLPAAMQSYIVISCGISLLQMFVMKIPAVKKFLKIPEAKPDPNGPAAGEVRPLTFREILDRMGEKFDERKQDKAYNQSTQTPVSTPVIQKTYEHNPLAQANKELFQSEEKQSMPKKKANKRKQMYKRRRDVRGPRM